MSRWFRIDNDIINDPKILLIPEKQRWSRLVAAFNGEKNEFEGRVKIGRGRPFLAEWQKLRTTVFERDDFTCRYCGKRGGKLECDHVVPFSKGGPDTLENLTTACFRCNRSKRDKMLEDWPIPHASGVGA